MNIDSYINIIWGLFSAVVTGLTVEIFFQLIKYKDDTNSKYPSPVLNYEEFLGGGNYLSVSQYLSYGHRKWLNYFLFRLIPPLIILILMAGALERYSSISNLSPYIILAGLLSLAKRDIPLVFKAKFISERLLHFLNSSLVILLACGVGAASQYINFGFIAPSLDGLIDNLWSSLIVALLVIMYLKATRIVNVDDDTNAKDITISNYVVSSFNELTSKYAVDIEDACIQNKCSKRLMYSVLIYENMNRPKWMRKIENSIVKYFKFELTIGIAQVKSNRPLTDRASIYKAAEILKNTLTSKPEKFEAFESTVRKYNSDDKYIISVKEIYHRLSMYTDL